MPKTVILTLGDVHIADKTPAFRIDDYRETMFQELDMVKEQCLVEKAAALLITGDIFNEKIAARVSHSIVLETVKKFKTFPCPVYSIIGNHDINHNRMDTLPKQPLGVVFASDALKKLDSVTIGGIDVRGVHFNEDNNHDTLAFKKEGKPLIAVCHVLATPKGGDFFGEPIFSYEKLAEGGSEVDVYVFGHYHHDQGIQTVGDKQFVNLGALARGALSKENVDRAVKMGKIVYDGKSLTCSEIILPVRPSSEIFDMGKKEEIDKRETEIEKFVSSLTKQDLFEDITSLEDTIRTMEIETPVKKRVVAYLNARGAGLNI